MRLEDWERRRLAGETPALPGRREGSMQSSREFSCSVAPHRRMGTHVGCHEVRGDGTAAPKSIVSARQILGGNIVDGIGTRLQNNSL